MSRYEGMDDLLSRVRDRLQGDNAPDSGPTEDAMPRHGSQHEELQGRILILLNDAEQLRAALSGVEARRLTVEEQEDLLALLDKVQRELRRCEAALEH